MTSWMFSAVVWLSVAASAVAAEVDAEAVAVVRKVQIKSAGTVVDELLPGAIVEVMAREGELLQIRTNKTGWIERSAVVPVSEAADYFTRAIAGNPRQAELYRARAMVYRSQRQFDRAIADFDEAVRLDPRSALAFAGRGVAWKQRGNVDRAIADLDEALKINPALVSGFVTRGQLWLSKHENDRAIHDFSAAQRLNPKNPEPYFLRALARGNDDRDQAVADCSEAIRLGLEDVADYGAKGYELRAILLYNQRKLADAILDLDIVLKADPDNTEMLFHRGNAWRRIGNHNKAIADFTQLVMLDPMYPDVYYWRAHAWEAKGDLIHALEDAEAAVQIDPSDPPALRYRDKLKSRLRAATPGGGG